MTPVLPKTFTPHKGLMSVAERLTRLAERSLGIPIWDGENGLGGVVADKLRELRVPAKPIQLTGQGSVLTPRVLAEQAGFIRKKRAVKRVKA